MEAKPSEPSADGAIPVAPASPTCNLSVIVGELVQVPERTELPSGSSLVSFSITVRAPGHKTTSVPLTWFDPPKKVDRWTLGDSIIAVGPVVRRFYHAGGVTRSRTDVAVTHAENLRSRKRAANVLARAIAPLADLEQALDPD